MKNEQLYLLDRVDITDDGCWIWKQAVNKSGYGIVGHDTKLRKEYGTTVVPRLSYIFFKGPIPEGLVVRHKCRSTKCCNPEHLELGTHHDNSQDKFRDGTDPKSLGYGFTRNQTLGSKNNQAKLTEEQVSQIKQLRTERKLKYRELAEMFNVSIATIGYVCKGQVWSHV